MYNYKYSIITASYNSLTYLMRTLQSIIYANYSGSVELIVVDDGSRDGTAKYLERFKDSIYNKLIDFKVIWNTQNIGAIKARNKALNLCSGEYIFQIDSDVIIEKDWEDGVFKYLKDDVIAVGPTGSYVTPDWSNFNHNGDKCRPGDYVDALMGYCWIWKNVNQDWRYNEDFGIIYHEEMYLQLDMKEAGYRLKLCDPIATHLGQTSEHRFINSTWTKEQENRKVTSDRFRKLVESGKISLELIPNESK